MGDLRRQRLTLLFLKNQQRATPLLLSANRVNFQGEDRMLQQAIEASMKEVSGRLEEREAVVVDPVGEDELAVALRISQEQEAERQERIQKEEEEMSRQVMELSLKEK